MDGGNREAAIHVFRVAVHSSLSSLQWHSADVEVLNHILEGFYYSQSVVKLWQGTLKLLNIWFLSLQLAFTY